jgi:hypothetical protein
VIHGAEDRMWDVSGGHAAAAAKLVVLPNGSPAGVDA